MLLDHLSLQGLDPRPVLTNPHSEPGRHILGLYLRLPLPLNLAREVLDPLMGINTFLLEPHRGLKQLIPFLPNMFGFHGV
jgi:hypothetical protein